MGKAKGETYLSSGLTQVDLQLLAQTKALDLDKVKEASEELERQKAIEEEKRKKRKTIVKTIEDLEYKYSGYSPKVTSTSVTLKEAFPASDLPQFRSDCKVLGLEAKIDKTGELSWNADH